MDRTVSQEQAKAFVGLLQSLLRELTAGSNDPAVELPLAQLRACSVLRNGPQSISAISRELGVSPSAVTQIADRLERVKLVRRVSEAGDRRVRCLQLTHQGETLLRLHDEERIARAKSMLNQLTPDARKQATAVLAMLGQAAADARISNGNGKPRRANPVLRGLPSAGDTFESTSVLEVTRRQTNGRRAGVSKSKAIS